MRLNLISIYKPSFTSIERPERKPYVSRPDCFVKSEFDYDKETKILYNKIQKRMGVVTPQDIVAKANKISKQTGVPLENVYYTMGLLSQYSSYKSLLTINKALQNDKINSIDDLRSYHQTDCKIPIHLTHVFSYLLSKNDEFAYSMFSILKTKKALLVDSNLIKTIQNDSGFYKDKNSNYYYIENFENGYNFLNQSKSFEDYTIEVIEKAKQLKSVTNKDFNYNVEFLLNSYVYSNLDTLTTPDIYIIKQENICTPEKIADNLNPIMPSYEAFKKTLDNIAKTNTVSKEAGEKYVIEALNSMFEPVTPHQLSKYLQELHTKIEKHLKNHGRDLDKVYYVVPNRDKSYALINYQYKKANNLDDMKSYVMCENDTRVDGLDVKNLEEGSTFVVVDDYLLSALSMINEQFPYDILSELSTDFRKKDMEVIFAPVFATEKGLERIDNYMKTWHRDHQDCVIPAKVLPDATVDDSDMPVSRSNKYLTSSVMPYMGPDSNAEEFVPLYKQFLCFPESQKATIDSFDIATF